jgi:hypothetical protein
MNLVKKIDGLNSAYYRKHPLYPNKLPLIISICFALSNVEIRTSQIKYITDFSHGNKKRNFSKRKK